MKHLSIDIETFSSVDIQKGGAYKYALSPDFCVLLFGYSVDFGPVQVVDFTKGEKLPQEIANALMDENVIKHAYNAAFEWWCLSTGWMKLVPDAAIKWANQWHCTMLHANYAGYPGGLKQTGVALGMPQDKLKSAAGTRLITLFCTPDKKTGEIHKPEEYPEKWEQFIEYNRQDVVSEMAIEQKLSAFPVPDEIQRQWIKDLEVNMYGFRLDTDFVDAAISITEEYTHDLKKEAKGITGIANPGSIQQLTAWMAERGIETADLRKETVEKIIEDGSTPADVRRVLEIRQETSLAALKKYPAMREAVCEDGRVRGLLQFYGANRTGRWAGRLVQVQNLPRVYMDGEMLDMARELVKAGNAKGIEMLFGSLGDTLKQLVRTAFCPDAGKKIVVADFSAIEARVIAWLAEEGWRQEAFKNGEDIYCASASQMFGVPVVKHGVNGHLRQRGKVAELALGYQGWTNAMIRMGALENGLTEEELPGIVLAWREASPHIVEMWKQFNNASLYTVRTGQPGKVHKCTFSLEQDPIYGLDALSITLPSGRKIFYPQVTVEKNDRNEDAVHYMSLENYQWVKRSLYGGLITENITQATARDCLQVAIDRIAELDPRCRIAAHVHDEVICEYSGEHPDIMYKKVVAAMSEPIDWAPGLLLSADGFISDYYKKD